MKVKFSQIGTHPIYHVNFSSQYDLTMTFLRFQEHYESPNPKFRGQIFTLEDYIEWYVKTMGDFTYYKDWSGFNVPSTAIDMVRDHFEGHTKREKFLLNLLKDQALEGEKFYLIGTYGDASFALKHEIAHGLFYTNSEYRKEVVKIVKKYRVLGLQKWLLKRGYCKAVLVDEIHAYALTGYSIPKTKEMISLQKELKAKVGHYLEQI